MGGGEGVGWGGGVGALVKEKSNRLSLITSGPLEHTLCICWHSVLYIMLQQSCPRCVSHCCCAPLLDPASLQVGTANEPRS